MKPAARWIVPLVLLHLPLALAESPRFPDVPREFRAVWIATVDNIDWPSRPGLSTAEQQQELRTMLDLCQAYGFNAVVFQVRPVGDALYASELEPWSAYLSGQQGEAPEPFYDPLTFAIEEAHARGLELHAWLNPFRAAHPSNDTVADTHVRKQHPEWVHKYGAYHWMDPGHPEALAHTLAVVEDIVARYDIDGLHFDDYFYPYPVDAAEGGKVPFPDSASWQMYQDKGGLLKRNDWRRDNINRMVQEIYTRTKQIKPHVKVGFSPFGIWRPGYPEQIKGFDAYEGLFADARLWLQEGWMDYLVPQLYWAIDPPGQSYPVLLKWWCEQNPHERNIYAGNAAHRALSDTRGWSRQELARQVEVTRGESRATGNVFFSAKWFAKPEVADPIAALYEARAVVPSSDWLSEQRKPAPQVVVQNQVLKLPEQDGIQQWVLDTKQAGTWHSTVLPGATREQFIAPDCALLVVRGVDRFGVLTPATAVALR